VYVWPWASVYGVLLTQATAVLLALADVDVDELVDDAVEDPDPVDELDEVPVDEVPVDEVPVDELEDVPVDELDDVTVDELDEDVIVVTKEVVVVIVVVVTVVAGALVKLLLAGA
jgi:hypothetical protein